MERSYIIKNDELIATCAKSKSIDIVYSFDKCDEAINANRKFNLLNAKSAKISNAKKWETKVYPNTLSGVEINEGEFYIS